MDVERIDWWEKERPPFVWINKKQLDAYHQFINERHLKFCEYYGEFFRSRFESDGITEKS